MFNLPWKLFHVAVTMSKLEVPGTRNYLHFLTQRSPQSTALAGLPGFSPEELLWDALPGEQTCRHQNISRYGDAHGRYAKCLNPRCLTKWMWADEVAGWVSQPSRVSSRQLPLPSAATIRDLHQVPPTTLPPQSLGGLGATPKAAAAKMRAAPTTSS